MPFKSKEQRTWMRINKPEMYKKWKKKYGTEIKKKKKRGLASASLQTKRRVARLGGEASH